MYKYKISARLFKKALLERKKMCFGGEQRNFLMYKNDEKGLLRTFFKVWGVLNIVYAYMVFNFFWGNHDWDFLKDGVKLSSGFFEGRFSQHIFSYFLFDGHILPVVTYFLSFAALVGLAFAVGRYLEIPQKMWGGLALFIGLNPHTFVLFYYFYLLLPFICWAGLGVLALFLAEPKFGVMKFLAGAFFYILLLGSYPPNLNFILTVFLARRLLMIWLHKQTVKEVFFCGCFFWGQLVAGYLGYKVVFSVLLKWGYLNSEWYNLQVRPVSEMLGAVPVELWRSLEQLFHFYHFMDWAYCVPLAAGCFAAIGLFIKNAENKIIAGVGIVVVFLVSRFAFLVSASSYIAVFRCEYWGRLGLYVFAFSILSHFKQREIKNFLFALGIMVLWIFVKTDLEIEKVRYLGFRAERLYHTRLVERVVQHKNFDVQGKYLSIAFGGANFGLRYYDSRYVTKEGEFLGNLTMPFQLIEVLFWEEKHNPVDIKAGVWDSKLFTLGVKSDRYKQLPLQVKDMRYWMYNRAEVFPRENFIYADDKFLLLNLDELLFARYREVVLKGIDY